MKKVLLILLISSLAHAQNDFRWADSASVWHYTHGIIGIGYAKYSYTGDTVIGNKNCQKIIEQTQQMIQTGPGIYTLQPVIAGDTVYLYKSNDSVFTYRNSNFYLAFKTNTTVGEIWDLGVYYPSVNNYHAYVKVDSVFYDTYNGVLLRNMRIYSCDSLGNQIYNQPLGTPDSLWLPYIALFNNNIVNEKFGPMVKLSGINDALLDNWLNEVMPSSLLCFQSDSFPFYQAGINDCNNGILTEIHEIKTNKEVYVFPSPSNEMLYITNAAQIASYQIFQHDGKLISQGNTFPVNMSEYANGLYFISINTKSNQVINQKIIKQ